jgi:hypothetical protein
VHATIFVLKDQPEWLDEYELFKAMNREWPGIDYVDSLTEEDSLEEVKSYANDPSYPEFQGKSIVITSKSKHERNVVHKRKIKALSEQIELSDDAGEDFSQFRLQLLLEGEPYKTYICYPEEDICYPEEDCPCVLTLDTFLRTADADTYDIVGVMDYHR